MFAERLICSWIGALGLVTGAFCQTYVQISVDGGTFPSSVNEKGEIAGDYLDFARGFHGFVRDPGGKITTFDAPGSFGSTRAFRINAAGAITGTFTDTTPVVRTRAYVRDPEGNFTTFDPPRGISTVPQSINAGGAIAGYYNESNLRFHGFVREPNGTISSIDPPGSISTQAFSINAKGAITGHYADANQRGRGFVRRPGGEFVSFDVPESIGSSPASINDAGAITGYYTKRPSPTSNVRVFGFVRNPDGKFTSFDPPLLFPSFGLMSETFPTSINKEGAITGRLESNDLSIFHGFVRSPEGTSTVFDPPFCYPRSTVATSLNDKGVITGSCSLLTPPFPGVGWVRFP
jgi:hypothetical protein